MSSMTVGGRTSRSPAFECTCEAVMPKTPAASDSAPAPPDLPLPPLPLPLFWPVAMVAGMEKAKADLALRNLEFVQEEIKLHGALKAKVASPNVVRLDLRTMVLRDYGRP